MAEKIKPGYIIGGLAVAGGIGVLIYAITRKVEAAPPEEVAAIIQIEVIGAESYSPVTIIEGETYTVRLTVTNLSTKAGEPWEATLKIAIEAVATLDTWITETLIPVQEREEYFSAGQTRTFDYTMNVPLGLGGYSGYIGASVKDPTGLVILAQATEPLVITTIEIIYGATISIGV